MSGRIAPHGAGDLRGRSSLLAPIPLMRNTPLHKRNSIRTGPTIMMTITPVRRTLTIQLGMTPRLLVSKPPDSGTDGDAGVTAGLSGTV